MTIRTAILPVLSAASFVLTVLTSGSWGCSGAAGTAPVLTLSPAGPTAVHKGETLAFTANLDGEPAASGVTFSVVGGDANGTIASDGVYTPPASIPASSARVTVQAEAAGQTATAAVDLRTGSDLTFAAALQADDTGLSDALVNNILMISSGAAHRVAAGLGSVHAYASWPAATGTEVDVVFARSVDLGAFEAEQNLTADVSTAAPIVSLYPQAVFFTSSATAPAVIYSHSDGTAAQANLEMRASADGGATFGAPVVIDPSPARFQVHADVVRRENGVLHLTYMETATSSFTNDGDIFYTRSEDDGLTWSVPLALTNTADSEIFPQIAFDPDTSDLFVCHVKQAGGSNTQAYVSRSEDGGASFGTPVEVTPGPSAGAEFCQIGAFGGKVYVVLTTFDSPSEVQFTRSTDGGAVFSPLVTLNDNVPNIQGLAYLAVDGEGRIDVIWGDDSGGSLGTDAVKWSRSTDGGVTFSTPEVLFAASAGHSFPAGLTHDEAGRLYVLYLTDQADPGVRWNAFLTVGE